MVTFSCKSISQEELIKCAFDLNKTDYNVFIFLLSKNKDMTTHEISRDMGLDRTTVQKSIKRLSEKELVLRKQKNLEKGGYIFVYSIKDKSLVKKRMSEIAKKWHDNVQKEISKW